LVVVVVAGTDGKVHKIRNNVKSRRKNESLTAVSQSNVMLHAYSIHIFNLSHICLSSRYHNIAQREGDIRCSLKWKYLKLPALFSCPTSQSRNGLVMTKLKCRM
jgi:hypothetical protein